MMPKMITRLWLLAFVLLMAACSNDKDGAVVEAPARYSTLTPTPSPTPSPTRPPIASPTAGPTSGPTSGVEILASNSAEASEAWQIETTLGLGTLDAALWTPDGTQIIVSGGAGLTWLAVDPLLPEPQQHLADYHAPFVFSPDGARLMVIGPDERIYGLDADLNPTPVRDSAGGWTKLAYAPDGRELAALGEAEILLMDMATQEIRRRLRFDPARERLLDMAYDAEGTLLVTLSHVPKLESLETVADYLRVVEAESGTERWTMAGPAATTSRVRFSANGGLLVVGDPLALADEAVIGFNGATLVDLTSGAEIEAVTIRDNWETAIAPSGTLMASQSRSTTNQLMITELPAGRQVVSMNVVQSARPTRSRSLDNPNFALDIEFSPDESKVALINGASRLFVFDLAEQAQIGAWEGFSSTVYDLAFAPNAQQLAAGGVNTIRLYPVGVDDPTSTTLLHDGRITALAFSPDGTQLATGSSRDAVALWDMATHQLVTTLNGVDNVQFLAYSPDGGLLIDGGRYVLRGSGSGELGVIRTWDTASSPRRPAYGDIEDMPGIPTAFAIAPDGSRLAWAAIDRSGLITTLTLIDPRNGRVLTEATLSEFTVNHMAFAADGNRLYVGGSDGYVRVFEIGTQAAQIAEIGLDTDAPIHTLAIDAAGTRLVVGQADGTLNWVRLNADGTGEWLSSVPLAHRGGVTALAIAADGTLASGGADGLIHMWKAETPETAAVAVDVTPVPNTRVTFSQQASLGQGGISGVYFSPDGTFLMLMGMSGGTVYRLPDLTAPITRFSDIRDPIAPSPDGNALVGVLNDPSDSPTFVTGDIQLVIQFLDATAPVTIESDLSFVNALVFAPDSSAFAVVGQTFDDDARVEVYSFPAGERLQAFDFADAVAGGVAFIAPDELLVGLFDRVTVDDVDPADAPLRIVEVFSNQERLALMLPPVAWAEVEFSPDAAYLHLSAYGLGPVSADGNYSLEPIDEPLLRRVSDGQSVQVPGVTAPIFAFSNDSRLYAFLSFSEEATVKMVDIAAAEEIGRIDLFGDGPRGGFFSPTRALWFSPDDSKLAVLTLDGTVRVFDVATGEVITSSLGGGGQVAQALDVSPDGQYIAVGTDSDIQLWDATTEQMLFSAFAFAPTTTLRFAPDGQKLAVGTLGGSANIWDFAAVLAAGDDTDGFRFGQHTRALQGVDFVTGVAVSSDGTRAITAGHYPQYLGARTPLIRIWDLTTTPLPRLATAEIDDLPGVPSAIALSPDDRTLAVMIEDRPTLLFFDAMSATPLGEIVLTADATLIGMAFTPDSRQLMVMLDSGGIVGIDVASRSILTEWAYAVEGVADGETPFYMTMALSRDGWLLAGGRSDGVVTVWDVASGAVVAEFQASSLAITALAFDADGQIVVGSYEGIVRVWGVGE